MNEELIKILDELVDELVNDDNVQKYIKLNNEINSKYVKELVSFNTAKEKCIEMKRYNTDISKYNLALSEAKNNLYSKDEVKSAKRCERLIQKKLYDVSNDISSYFSNKFKKKEII